ncbi:MAG: hypothetical protein M1827_002032 [Pycnora praestabilis]|nr:MAG: hypothetical protein M1827_002032 [Pycnora praestabilis]
MSGPSNGQTPRSSTSSGPSSTSSLIQSSSSSPSHHAPRAEVPTLSKRQSRSSLDPERMVGQAKSDSEGKERESLRENLRASDSVRRRHRPTSSGGFLLKSTFATVDQLEGLASKPYSQEDVQQDIKGKRKLEPNITSNPKSTHHHHRPKNPASLGSSPLATEVLNVEAPSGASRDVEPAGNNEENFQYTSESRYNGSLRSSRGSAADPISKMYGEPEYSPNHRLASLGLDTDPAQVVSLALSLSEGRRRNVSDARSNTLNSKRTVPAGQPPIRDRANESHRVSRLAGSLRQLPQQQRQISQNISPTTAIDHATHSNPSHQRAGPGSLQLTILPAIIPENDRGLQYKFSGSTLARAEKARVSLELSTEYRRLLSCLAPLKPQVQESKIASSQKSRSSVPSESHFRATKVIADGTNRQTFGRAYNPLQCIRNRKVRARKGRIIDPEADGWADLDQVKIWVDKVERDSIQHISPKPGALQLPSFPEVHLVPSAVQSPSASGGHHRTGTLTSKPRRPRVDWLTPPIELFADAYWVEQSDNMTLIEDRHGEKILSTDSSPSHTVNQYSQEEPPLGSMKVKAKGDSAADDRVLDHQPSSTVLRSPRSLLAARDRNIGEWDQQHSQHWQYLEYNRDIGATRWLANEKASRSRSSSFSSGNESFVGWGEQDKANDGAGDNIDSDILERQMMEMLEQDSKKRHKETAEVKEETAASLDGNRPTARLNDGNSRNSSRHYGALSPSDRRIQSGLTEAPRDQHRHTRSLSPITGRERKPRKSLETPDITAPSSLGGANPTPSNAIRLMPPGSPQDSPTKKRLPSRKGFLRIDRSKERHAICANDFAVDREPNDGPSRSGSIHAASRAKTGLPRQRASSPTKKLFARKTISTLGEDHGSPDTLIRKSGREEKETDSRLRGIFKGGRIEEIVRSEVSKMGDFIWKKDGLGPSSLGSSSASSHQSGSSDSDASAIGHDHLGRWPAKRHSDSFTDEDDGGYLSRKSTTSSQPKYHLENLPKFISPFARDEIIPNLEVNGEDDHISRQQQARREQRRPSRFERLAPPRIDMGNVSPGSSPDLSRAITQETGGSEADSRRSSYEFGKRVDIVPFGSYQGVRSADTRLNAVLGLPGTIGRGGPPVTGLARLAASESRHFFAGRPGLQNKRQWSISDRVVSTACASASKQEIARVRALLLSSGIKAKEISRRANEIRDPPAVIIQKLPNASLARVSRVQEHTFAARVLSNEVELTTRLFEDAAKHFSRSIISNLHDQIAAIEERITLKLTPLVRASADNADAFSAELTTTHTLAVKQLNDSVDIMMRRRRRRLRWVRRGGFVLLEWILLGVMWWVWLVFVIVRLIRCAIGGIVRGLRWLIWL